MLHTQNIDDEIMMIKPVLTLTVMAASTFLSACSTQSLSPQTLFMDNLRALCGQSFVGDVISDDPQDDEWRVQTLTVHVRDCEDNFVKIPLTVGEDRSRTWVITQTEDSLTLKHEHRHSDGSFDVVSNYGGETQSPGTPNEQAFPVDDFSKDLFANNNLEASTTNTWIINIEPGSALTYALAREGRDFRVKFDLSRAVKTPAPAWGAP